MVEQVRRLRRDSQSRSGRPRVTVRANYVGLPSMAGRGTDEGGESRRIVGLEALSGPRKYGPEAQNRRSGAPDGAASLSWDVHAGAHEARDAGRPTCAA
jgi:hypothetical protein